MGGNFASHNPLPSGPKETHLVVALILAGVVVELSIILGVWWYQRLQRAHEANLEALEAHYILYGNDEDFFAVSWHDPDEVETPPSYEDPPPYRENVTEEND